MKKLRRRIHRRRPLPKLPKRRGCQCLCHVISIGGEACPVKCKNFGKRFDGCHVCDCLKKCRKEKASKRALRELGAIVLARNLATLILAGAELLGSKKGKQK